MALSVTKSQRFTFTGTAATTTTFSYSMGSGSSGTGRVLMVGVQRDSGVTATYNGVSMTRIANYSGSYRNGALFYIEDTNLPADTSAHDIVFTWGGNRTDVDCMVLECAGAKQSATITPTLDDANGTTHTVTHVTTVNGVATFIFYWRYENRTPSSEPGSSTVHLTGDAGPINDGYRLVQFVGPTPAGSTDYTWTYPSGCQFLAFTADIEAAAGGTTINPWYAYAQQ